MRSIEQFISYMLNDKVKIWYNSNLDSHPGAHIVSSLHLYCRPVTKCQATILRDHFTQLPPLFTSRLPSPTCQPSNCSFTSSTVDRSGALQLWRPWLVWLQSADSHPESRHRRCQVRSHLTPMGAYALSPVACIYLQALIQNSPPIAINCYHNHCERGLYLFPRVWVCAFARGGAGVGFSAALPAPLCVSFIYPAQSDWHSLASTWTMFRPG